MSVCADFAFERKLGAGANGSVFHVRRVADQQEYALKQIDGFDELAPPAQATVLREVKLLAAVNHPHVVSYMESFIEDGRLHIVMELCEGGDVHSMLRRRAGALLPESEVWRLYGEALRGLEHLHSLQILHRDVKSMNLFLAADGSLRLGDLGVARQLSPSTAVAHTVIGTPYYLSPELCNGQPYGAKADVWALGVVLYELLTAGQLPFTATNQAALVLRILRGEYAPPAAAAGYSCLLLSTLAACLAPAAEERPSTAQLLMVLDELRDPKLVRANRGVEELHDPKLVEANRQGRGRNIGGGRGQCGGCGAGGDAADVGDGLKGLGREVSEASLQGTGGGFPGGGGGCNAASGGGDRQDGQGGDGGDGWAGGGEPAGGGAVEGGDAEPISMLPTRGPVPGSPLHRALERDGAAAARGSAGRARGAGRGSGARGGSGRSTGPPIDQPVTFRAKISSSGYGASPAVTRLHAGGPATQAARARARAANGPVLGRHAGAALARRYNGGDDAPVIPQPESSGAVAPLGAAQLRSAFAPDASRLAVGGADGSVSLLRLPTRRHPTHRTSPPTLCAHERVAIRSVEWSLSGRLLLSASADGSACLWDVDGSRTPAAPLLHMTHTHRPPPMLQAGSLGLGTGGTTAAASAGGADGNAPFKGDVWQASFFYLDRFILLANGPALRLYSYTVEHGPPAHDARRAAELRHRYALRHAWAVPGPQHLTCFTCAASYLSPIAIAAGSDRSLSVLDWGAGKQVRGSGMRERSGLDGPGSASADFTQPSSPFVQSPTAFPCARILAACFAPVRSV